MPRIKKTEVTVYKFEELSDKAKEKARDWYREGNDDTFWAENVVEDFESVLTACGYSVERARGSTSQPAIYWEGFAHQGSGASFNASWRASDVNVATLIADRPVTYKDEHNVEQRCESNARLVPMLERMDKLAQADREAYGNTKASNRYHNQSTEYATDEDVQGVVERENEFDSLCDDLAAYLYWSLDKENDYQNSDEVVDENITINEYEFTVDGKRA